MLFIGIVNNRSRINWLADHLSDNLHISSAALPVPDQFSTRDDGSGHQDKTNKASFRTDSL